ncbi:MAG: hypothetical protein NTY77_10025 [Elusimicrobia bacterium]|nr:hypothetical protein [Elusimicrobiota bacterium]
MKHCPVCNTMLPDTSDQCNFCWEKLDAECYGQPIEQKPVRIPYKLILIFLMAAAAGAYWWKIHEMSPEAVQESSVHIQVKDVQSTVP